MTTCVNGGCHFSPSSSNAKNKNKSLMLIPILFHEIIINNHSHYRRLDTESTTWPPSDYSPATAGYSSVSIATPLKQSGINKSLLLWINNALTHRTHRVVVDGCQSREAAVTSGVPQRTVLGPLFFLVYINDIQRNIGSKLRLFADDSLLYRQTSRDSCIFSLQI